MRAAVLAVLLLLVALTGCTTEGAEPVATATPPIQGAAPSTPAESPATEAGDAAASPEPLDTASPDLSGLDEIVEDFGLSPQTVLAVSLTACTSLAEGLDREQAEQRIRDLEGDLGLGELDAEQLTAVVDAGIQALCPSGATGG